MSLRALALLSGVYDLLLGLPMLLAAPLVARLFGAPEPVPVVNAWLNGVFALALAWGYSWAARDVSARRGYLWAATTWGLCRWDGERFATLSVPEGLPSPNTRSLLEDEHGRLWIGTNNGLAVYDGRRIEVPADLGGLPRSAVWAAERDPAGRLWIGTESGLLLYDGHGFRGYRTEAGLPDRYVYALHAARDGALWVGTRGAGAARCELAADGHSYQQVRAFCPLIRSIRLLSARLKYRQAHRLCWHM